MDDMEVDRNDRVGVELDMVGAEGGADALGSPDKGWAVESRIFGQSLRMSCGWHIACRQP
jgi:hypothetical protein